MDLFLPFLGILFSKNLVDGNDGNDGNEMLKLGLSISPF